MGKEWGRFLTALEAKGITFGQIQFASDRQTVIRATGFTDPLSIALIETEWQKQQREDSGGHVASAVISTRSSTATTAAGGPSLRESKGEGRRGPLAPLTAAVPSGSSGNGGAVPLPALDDFSQLATLPEEIQDVVVANEVLAAALGFGGALIQYQAPLSHHHTATASRSGQGGEFVVSSYVPLSLRGLCQTILPVADAFVAVRRVEETEYVGRSLVGMALGEIVSEVVTSYAHQITKLQRWCFERAMPLMGVVSEILRVGHHMVRLRQVLPMDLLLSDTSSSSSSNMTFLSASARGEGMAGSGGGGGGIRGPRILNHLTEQAERCAGSREDSELVQLLLRRALVPYLRMLHRWMHEGVLEDPFGEFFITEAYAPTRPAPTALTNSRSRNVNQLFPESSLMVGTEVADAFGSGGAGVGAYAGNRSAAAVASVVAAALARGSTVDGRELPSGLTCEQLLAQQQQDVLNFERRFSMNTLMIPSFLEKPGRAAKMVFFAGKYRCLLREYNDIRPVFGEAAEGMLVWSGVDALHRRVQESFDITSQAVIQLLFSSSVDLMGHLQSLKNYFLHERGDWVVDFLDSADELLRHAAPDRIRVHPLRVLLQAAIARSCGAADPYHDLIGCSLSDMSLSQHLDRMASAGKAAEATAFRQPSGVGGAGAARGEARHALDLLQLDAALQWPLTLVLDAAVIQRFNSIFRLLTWMKSCERHLGSLWYTNEVLSSFSEAYIIKHQLTHFLRQFQFYAAHFVLEPLWSRLLRKMGQADSVFAINNALRDFFKHVEMGLVLSSPHRFLSLASILTLSSRFCEVGMFSSTATMPLIEATLHSMHEELLRALSELASPVGEDYAQLVPLFTWIDFSGFYGRNNIYHLQRGGGASA